MEQINTDESQEEERLLASEVTLQVDEVFTGLHSLGLRLLTELGACVQQVSGDLTQVNNAGDLETARQRWVQHLRALADMVEGYPNNQYTSLLPSETPLHELPPYPRRNATTQPITVATRVPVAAPDTPPPPAEQAPREMPINPPLSSTYRWVPLTVREREVLKLTQRGYPPRRIAPCLVVSVETVYTHLRNIRRKQREWEREHQAQAAQQQTR